MQRSVTAIYRTHATAALVRDELVGLGISRGNIELIPDHDQAGSQAGGMSTTADPTGTPGTEPHDMSGGIARSASLGAPDRPVGSGGMGGGAGMSDESGGADRHDHDDNLDRIHDLALPEDDTRIYQQAVRNGDHVVCVHLDDADHLTRVQEVMRRPEDAYNLAELDDAYAHAPYEPRRSGTDRTAGEGMRGTRDLESRDPGLRSYSRNSPLPPRGGML